MGTRSSLVGCGLFLLTLACTVTRSGTLSRFPSGVSIPLSVVVDTESATVLGTNPESGEHLSGTFHLSHEAPARVPGGVLAPAPPVGGGAVSPGTGPRPAAAQPSVVEMTGRLEGDKGTSLRCTLQVKRGLRVEGFGACRDAEGEDAPLAFRIRF